MLQQERMDRAERTTPTAKNIIDEEYRLHVAKTKSLRAARTAPPREKTSLTGEMKMPQPDRIPAIPLHDEHVVTAREALEGLYLKLQQEAEVRMVAAALRAGWSAEEAIDAIDDLRKEDVPAVN
ncbi:hypothetical protein BCL32_1956 [Rhizobium mongolense USDA 1844]|uniref:Uncharacterized protein n=2 Tax=Rhizobium mongolense TaxID=57676 RepID=A0A559TGH2_9HYPH|nr:hypothetical protein BCL32_1956 [Rhizobium mongolense USDA 1844]